MAKMSLKTNAALLGLAVGILVLYFTSKDNPESSVTPSRINTMGGDSPAGNDSSTVPSSATAELSRHGVALVDIAEVYAITGNPKSSEQSILQISSTSERNVAIDMLIRRLKDNHGFFFPTPRSKADKTEDDQRVVIQVQALLSLIRNINDPLLESEKLCLAAECRSNLPSETMGLPTVEELLLQSQTAANKGSNSTFQSGSLYLTVIEWFNSFWTVAIPGLMAFCSYLGMKIFETISNEFGTSISNGVAKVASGTSLSLLKPSTKMHSEHLAPTVDDFQSRHSV